MSTALVRLQQLLLVLMIGTVMLVAGRAIIPVEMKGLYVNEETHTAYLRVGNPPTKMLLAIDFNTANLCTVEDLASWSKTHSATAGGTDTIHLGQRPFRIQTRVGISETMKCADCVGSLGLSVTSHLWRTWRNVTLSAGSIILGEHDPPTKIKSFRCVTGHKGLCLAKVMVYGKPYNIDFSFATTHTLLPPALWSRYVGNKNVGKNSDPREWQPFDMDFGGKGKHLVLLPEQIVPMGRSGERSLVLLPGPSNNTIYVGRSMWRSMILYRDFAGGTMTALSWSSCKNFSDLVLVFTIVIALLVVRWKMSRHDTLEGGVIIYSWRLAEELVGITVIQVIYWMPTIRESISKFKMFDTYFAVFIYLMLGWEILSLSFHVMRSSVLFGPTVVTPIPNNPGEIPTTVNMNTSIHTATTITQTAMTTNPRYTTQPGKLTNRKAHFPQKPFTRQHSRQPRYVLIMERACVVRDVTHEMALLAAALLLTTETRVDTLGRFFTFLFSLSIIFNFAYYSWITLYLSVGIEMTLLWALYLLTWWIALLPVGVVVLFKYVAVPFLESEIPQMSQNIKVLTGTVFAFVACVASILAVVEISRQRKRSPYLIRQTVPL